MEGQQSPPGAVPHAQEHQPMDATTGDESDDSRSAPTAPGPSRSRSVAQEGLSLRQVFPKSRSACGLVLVPRIGAGANKSTRLPSFPSSFPRTSSRTLVIPLETLSFCKCGYPL
jgi:hypothetical protein